MSFSDEVTKLQGVALKQFTEDDFKGKNLVATNDAFRRFSEQLNSAILALRAIPAELTKLSAAPPPPPTYLTVNATEVPDASRTLFTFTGTPIAVYLNGVVQDGKTDYTQHGNAAVFAVAPGVTDKVSALVSKS